MMKMIRRKNAATVPRPAGARRTVVQVAFFVIVALSGYMIHHYNLDNDHPSFHGAVIRGVPLSQWLQANTLPDEEQAACSFVFVGHIYPYNSNPATIGSSSTCRNSRS